MQILPHGPVNTEDWAATIPQYPLPDWRNRSHDEFRERGKRWQHDPADRPWFDQPGALEKVAALRGANLISADEETLLRQFVVDGYFVLENTIDESEWHLLDEYNHDLNAVWSDGVVRDGLQVSGLRVDGRKRDPIAHAELLSWPLEKRLHLRDSETWRIHYFQAHTRPGLGLARARKLVRLSTLLLDRDPTLLNLTTYKYSSEVALHQDMWFYHLYPINQLVGVWLACEDVTPETGPLAVYPGSQKAPVWPGFSNYPQTNYRTCPPETHMQIEEYLGEQVKSRERVTLPVKKGTGIFLNGLLIHDADKVQKRGVHSRFSIVFHYTVRGTDRRNEVEGPFNY
jgi:phytanoyl-CoA hydroxylase